MTIRRRCMHAAAIGVLTASIAGTAARPAAHDRTSQVTWTTDVAPILQLRCLGCHTVGGYGSIPLDTYEEARTWAKGIREAVLERRMPPWPAARGFGDFANDRSLTPIEIELLTAWADGATPFGPAVTAAHDTTLVAAARPPDLLVRVPAPHRVNGLIDRIELPTNLPADRWITGWEFRPGNGALLEQAVVSIAPATPLGTWTPAEHATTYPRGIAQRLPAGSRLVLELHYRKSSTPQTDESGVALYFGGKPARELRHLALGCGPTVLERGIEALAITPRASDAGATIEAAARHPDGRVEALAVVPRYEPAYPIAYRFRTSVRLRRGTAVELRSSSPGCSAALEFVPLQ